MQSAIAPRITTLTHSTIGQKAIVALTGMILWGYTIVHTIGNLQLFAGPEIMNGYAEQIHAMPAVLWGVRVLLLVCLTLHVWMIVRLASRNSEARPIAYKKRRNLKTNPAAIYMLVSGVVLFGFIIFHLMHLTIGNTNLPFDRENVYNNLVLGFRNPWVAGGYLICQLMLAGHLFHGARSLFQSIGVSHPKYDKLKNSAAMLLVAVVIGGNLLIPAAIVLRQVPDETEWVDGKRAFKMGDVDPNAAGAEETH